MNDKSPLISYIMNIVFYIVLSILLVLWLLTIICRRHRALQTTSSQHRRQAVGPDHVIAFSVNHELPPGLDTSAIETFPKFTYSGSDPVPGKMKMTGECAVCLGAFEEKETLRLLPKCGHVFHAECVDIWLGIHATCPFCRAILLPPEDAASSGDRPTQFEVVINVNDGRER